MANLGPLQQNLTYGNLLQVDGGLSSTLQPVLDGDGNASGLSLSLTGVGISGLVADSAANLYAGSTGALPYQISANNTGFVAAGVVGQLLASNGLAAPTWTTVTPATLGALASNGSIAMTGNLAMGSHKITGLLTPSADTDAATKAYVDSLATGLQVKAACRLATTTNLASLTGPATVDGIAVATGDRILVKSQTAEAENGIYVANVSTSPLGLWTRATDADTWGELVGAATFITAGDTLANTTWVSNTTAGGTLGTTDIEFVLFGASAAYSAGTGLTLVGSQFSLSTPVSLANGGTGATSAASALNVLLPAQSGYSGRYLTTDGTNATWGVVTPYDPSSVAITGGTINGVTIGGSLPLAGSFTNLTTTTSSSLNGFITTNNTAAFLRTPRIWDDSQTHWYRITPSELALDVYSTLPALTGNDTFVFQNHTQTLTNKTISGASNTLTNIGNAALTNSSITINGTAVSLGGSISVGGGGTVTSVALTAPTGLTVSGSPVTSSGTLALSLQSGYSIPTTAKQAEWDTAFAVRYRWDGGSTGLVPATGRSSLGLGNIATISTTGSTTNFLRADGTWAAPAGGGSTYINVTQAPYNASTAAADNSAAFNAALATGNIVYVPPGTYNFTSTINILNASLYGSGWNTTLQFNGTSATTPLIAAGRTASIKDIRLRFNPSRVTGSETAGQRVLLQTNYNDGTINWGLQRGSLIENVQFDNCGTAIYAQAPGTAGPFSVTFDTCEFRWFSYRGVDLNEPNSTGCLFNNLYFGAGGREIILPGTLVSGQAYLITQVGTINWSAIGAQSVSTQAEYMGLPFTYNGAAITGSGGLVQSSCDSIFVLTGPMSECSINQCNFEWSIFRTNAAYFSKVQGITATAIHFERAIPATNGLSILKLNSCSADINALSMINTPFTASNIALVDIASAINYGGATNPATANYYNFGIFNTIGCCKYSTNGALDNPGLVVFRRSVNDGPVYVELGNYEWNTYYADANFWRSFPTSGTLEFISSGVNSFYNVPSRTLSGITNFRNDSLTTPATGGVTAFYRPTTGAVAGFFIGSTASGQLYLPAVGGTPAFYAGSDYRLKENITPIVNATDRMKGVQTYNYNLIGESRIMEGFLAHEIASVCPDAVLGEKDAIDEDGNPVYQQVGPALLIPIMAQAIKDLIGRIESLENNNG